jgi:glycosyltransferase involved in cell wall biosynthesis
MRRLRIVPHIPVILAPRGELASGALVLRQRKKQFYMSVARLLGLYKNVTWHASSAFEAKDIERRFGSEARVKVAANLSAPVQDHAPRKSAKKPPLRLIFIGRIARNKNLDYALRILSEVKCNARLTICGPKEDLNYWRECEVLISLLPKNVDWRDVGAVEHARVSELLVDHDVLFLPTAGENYGHAIAEAFAVGCPVLISDKTPWRGLQEKQAGWAIPLDDRDKFVRTIEHCALLSESEWQELQQGAARMLSKEVIKGREQENADLFHSVLEVDAAKR